MTMRDGRTYLTEDVSGLFFHQSYGFALPMNVVVKVADIPAAIF
jgi:hypothetical protein